MVKFRFGSHYCHTPRRGSKGKTYACGDCGAVYRYQESDRTDKYGRSIKHGSWIQIRSGNR